MKVIHLCPSTPNKGDDFVGIGIHKLLAEHIPSLEYESIAASSKIDFNQIGVGGITSKTIDLLNSNDLIVIGGSNLYETMEIEVDPDALSKIKKPVLLIGIGAGWDFKSPNSPAFSSHNAQIIQNLHQKAIGSSVRDLMTQRALRRIGIEDSIVTGCPATFIYNDQLKINNNSLVYLSCLPYRMYEPINMDLRIVLWRNSYKRKRAITYHFKRLVRYLKKNKINTKIFITDVRDIPIAEKLCAGFEIISGTRPQTLLEKLTEANVIIGYRLHSCIPAVGMGIPVIPITADGRSMAFVETYGMPELAVNPFEPGSEIQIYNLMRKAIGDGQSLWNFMISKRDYFRKIMNDFLDTSLNKIS